MGLQRRIYNLSHEYDLNREQLREAGYTPNRLVLAAGALALILASVGTIISSELGSDIQSVSVENQP